MCVGYLLQCLLEFNTKQWSRLGSRNAAHLKLFIGKFDYNIQCDCIGES